MIIKSKKTTFVASATAMVISGLLVVGAAELVGPTDYENKSDKLALDKMLDEYLEETTAEIVPVETETLMAIEESQKEEETQTQETETAKEEPTEEETSALDGQFMVNVDEYLNVRAAADKDADVVGKLYSGTGGTVVEKGEQWTKISSGSVEGYVSTEYLLFGADAEAKAKEAGALKATVLEDSIRIRKEANTESGVWGLAEQGDVYSVNNELDSWVEINYDGEAGFIAKEFVNVEFKIGTAISIEEEQEQERLAAEAAAREEAAREEARQAALAEEQRVAAASQFVETVQTSAYDVSEDDVYLLACLVCAEAGSEPYEGKLAVANVVLNRLNGGAYGNSISDVIYARGQFTVAASGRLAKVMAQGPNSESITAAESALAGENNVPYYSNFRSCSVANYSSYNNYTIIGSQVFFN